MGLKQTVRLIDNGRGFAIITTDGLLSCRHLSNTRNMPSDIRTISAFERQRLTDVKKRLTENIPCKKRVYTFEKSKKYEKRRRSIKIILPFREYLKNKEKLYICKIKQ